MKTLYLECNMGCSGDMLLGALLELLPDPQQWLDRFHQIGLPRVRLEQSTQAKCGIYGTHVSVLIDGSLEETEGSRDYHHHAHHDLGHLSDLIRALAIPDRGQGAGAGRIPAAGRGGVPGPSDHGGADPLP